MHFQTSRMTRQSKTFSKLPDFPPNLAFAQSNEIYSNSFRVTIFNYVPERLP